MLILMLGWLTCFWEFLPDGAFDIWYAHDAPVQVAPFRFGAMAMEWAVISPPFLEAAMGSLSSRTLSDAHLLQAKQQGDH